MANEIKLKRGSGSDPGASDLSVGEVAIRTDNGKLFTKKDNGTVAEITGGGGIDDGDKGDITVSNSGATFTIDDGVVSTDKIAATAVTSAKMATNAVGAGALQENAVETAKIQNGAVTNAKVASDAAIDGSKIDPTFTSNITISRSHPRITFTDTDQNPDYLIDVNGGHFLIHDATNGVDKIKVTSDGHIDMTPNVDFGAGIDVTGEITGTSHIDLPDNANIKLGTGDDFRIFFDATNSIIQGYQGGSIKIRHSADDGSNSEDSIVSIPDGAVELYHNGSKKFETTSSGVTITGGIIPSPDGSFDIGNSSNRLGDVYIKDSKKLKLGDSADLEIFHNGSNSIINDNGTGTLQLQLGGSTKLEIQSGGVGVTGTCTATTFSGALTGNVTGNASGSSGSCTGNAATATALETARTIAGVSFDGTGNISLNNNAITNGAGYLTSVGTSNISDDAVTFAKIENVAQNRILGRTSSGTGSVDALTAANVRSMINVEDGATADQTKSDIDALNINADTVDSLHASSFLRADANDTTNSTLEFSVDTTDVINFSANSTNDARGIAFNLRTALSADYNDGYLRLNNGSEFTNGVYTPLVMRADGGFNVDGTEVISGSGTIAYSKLTGTPTIPTNNNQLTNGAGYITSASDSTKMPLSGGEFTGNITTHDVIPDGNNSRNLGSSSARFANLFVNDMHFANSSDNPNKVDGTWGDWTLQEGEDQIYMLNNRNGKKYKMNLTEIV